MAPASTERIATPAPQDAASANAIPSPPLSATRLRKEATIRAHAQSHFARFGFDGASLEGIAADAGMSRHSLLYYYPSKEALYRSVLDEVLASWLGNMSDLSVADDPFAALQAYIEAKMRLTQSNPQGVRVFTQEILAGAPRYGEVLVQRVVPSLHADVARFERWFAQGLIAQVDFTHLLFLVWAMTQAYADHEAQFALYLGKPRLEVPDYAAATQLMAKMVIATLRP